MADKSEKPTTKSLMAQIKNFKEDLKESRNHVCEIARRLGKV